MKKPIQISIPIPCHEKWADMVPADKGRFCAACQKTVIDFRRMSDREIAEAFSQNNSLCGRFRSDQLNRDLVVQKEKNQFWAAASAAVISFLTLGNHEAVAQEPVSTEQNPTQNENLQITIPETLIIKGVVNDETGPLPGATIKNLVSQKETFSDIDGEFKIEAGIGDTIEISYTGYKSSNILIKDGSLLTINMLEPNDLIIVVDGTAYFGHTPSCIENTQNRTLLGRIFHSIGNWFR